MSTLERAIAIAVDAHSKQKDKAGKPYILHPIRIMLQMKSDTEMIVAVLHDAIEDTSWTLGDLRREGFSQEALNALEHLTHQEGQSYEEYIQRIKRNPVARKIKLADLRDNMDISRLDNLVEKDLERLKKYHRSWLVLAERE